MRVFPAAFALAGGLLLFIPVCGETLRGRVLDRAVFSDSREAGPGLSARLVLHDTTGRRLGARKATKTGAYAFRGLKPGRYILTVESRGYLPSPLVRVLQVGPGDTLSRDFALDKAPRRNHSHSRESGRRKSAPHGYYTRLAEGMLASGPRTAARFREAAYPFSLGRFFDAEDTTAAYRRLWTALLWAEIESQERPVEHRIYLAHALDSALKSASWPALPALADYLKTSPDSLEAFAARARAAILSPTQKNVTALLKRPALPKSLAVQVLDGHLSSRRVPLAKKRAFLAKARGVLGAAAVRRLTAAVDARESVRKAGNTRRRSGKPAPPSFDSRALWRIVAGAAAGKAGNPVAQYHLGYRLFETGKHRDALAHLRKANAARPGYARGLHAEARAHLALGDSAAAERLFASLAETESTPWQALGWQALGRLQWRSGRAEEAEASLVRSLGLDEDSDSARAALMLLAGISVERNTWPTVEPMLEALVERRPREAEAHYWLGRMAVKGKQEARALERFRKARESASTRDPVRILSATAEAEVHFNREEFGAALEILKAQRARLDDRGLSLYGRSLLVLGRAKEAVSAFQRMHGAKPSARSLALLAAALNASGQASRSAALIAASPFNSSPEIRLARAETHLALGEAQEARNALEPMRERSPEDPRLHHLLARAAFQERNYQEASRRVTEALRLKQDFPEAIHLKGVCLLKLGRGGEALHYFGELAAMAGPSWRAKGLSGQGQAFALEGSPEKAVDHLARSFAESPSAEAAAHLALACLRMGKKPEAAAWAGKARRLDPGEPLGLMAAVDLLLADGREEEARALAAAGLERNPASCDFLMVAAKVNLKSGKDEEAKGLSVKAMRTCPSEPAPHYFLGSLSAKAGLTAEAKRHFGAYLASGGDAKRVPAGYR